MNTEQPVRRRHVFFFSGFDPKGAAYYHRIYREQAQRQGRLNGSTYEVGARTRTSDGHTRWPVRATAPDGQGRVDTVYEYLRWDDIVRAQWPRSAGGVVRASLRAYRAALGPARRAWPVAPRAVMLLFYPALCWCLVLLLATAWGLSVASLAQRLGPTGSMWPALWGAAAGAACLWAAWWLEGRLHTSWLLRIFAFAHAWATGRVPGLQARLEEAAEQVCKPLADPNVDEVLLVGFSVGSIWAVSVADRCALRVGPHAPALGRLSVLTLGHCVPLLGLVSEAQAFRDALQRVAVLAPLCWVDVSAPGDWGSFALVDPVPLCAPADAAAGAVNPRLLASPRFHTLFGSQAYARLKKDKRRMHMQYLMAGERAGVYDYFALTAGPLGLRERLAHGRVS
jgi:hypothetical protein